MIPISLTAGSYNQDIVVEAGASQTDPYTGTITATMDAGTAKTGATWYAVGFNTSAPLTGLPMGTTVAGAFDPTISYSLASAVGNNAVLLSFGSQTATITFATPARYSKLSLLTASSFSGGGPRPVGLTLNFSDAFPSDSSPSALSRDWFNNAPVAINAAGRLTGPTGTTDNVGGTNPRLYDAVVTLPTSDWDHPISSITLDLSVGGSGPFTAVFAISGELVPVPETSHVLPAAVGALALAGFARRRFYAAA